MRAASLLIVIFWVSLACAQESKAKRENHQPKEPNIPMTLKEAHAALERMLSAQELAKIDAMPFEDDMIEYHMGLGAGLRNSWGLWQGSPLANHLQGLGFTHPDDMSVAILKTFWCKRHGQDLRLEERAGQQREWLEAERKAREEQEKRNKTAQETMRKMMMGLRFERRDVPVVRMPITNRMSVRFLCPFRGGVFGTVYCQGGGPNGPVAIEWPRVDPADGAVQRKSLCDDFVARGFSYDPPDWEPHKLRPGEDFYIVGYFFELADRKMHEIRVEGVDKVYATVVAGGRAWFAGLANGKAVLVGVDERDRITVPLPLEDEIPDLGLYGPSLLAVYAKTIYRLTDRQWTPVHSGDLLLPRSGLPAERHGNMVFLRDEGRRERHKRLWWLTMGEHLHLSVLDRDMGLSDPVVWHDPRNNMEIHFSTGPAEWDYVSSYCVTRSGDLWACVGGWTAGSLVRRSKDGNYAIALLEGSVRFPEDVPGSRPTGARVSISAVAALPDDTLLLAGQTGLYRLKGNALVQELAFVREKVVDTSGIAYVDYWTPSTVLMLDDRSYVLGTTMWDGVYVLRQGDDGQWNCISLHEKQGDTVVW